MHDGDAALANLAAGKHGIFTYDDARRCGLTRNQIEDRVGNRWCHLYDGVYRVAGAPMTWRGELLAATLAAGKQSGISHRSAAAFDDLPGGRGDLVELSCLRWKRSVRPGL